MIDSSAVDVKGSTFSLIVGSIDDVTRVGCCFVDWHRVR